MPLISRVHLTERPLLILLATVQFTHIMDFMVMMPLGPQLMRELSISAPQFSALIAAYTIVSGIVGLLVAPFIDRFDRRTVLLTLYAGFILGTLGCALSNTASELILARATCGAFGGVCNAVILAIVGDLVPHQRRGAAMGIVMTSFSAAAAFGVPFGLFLAQTFRWETPFIFLAATALFVEGALFLCLPHVRGHLEGGPPASWKNFRSLLSNTNVWRALLLMVSLVFGRFTIIPFLSPHLVFNVHLPEKYLALVYVMGGLFTIITAPWIGRLSDRHGKTQVFTVVVSVAVFVILAISNASPLSIGWTLLLTTSFFVFASGRYVPAQAVLASAVPAAQRGAFMSLSACTRDLCTGIAAMFAGWIVVKTPEALLNVGWLGWISAALSVLSIWLIRRVQAVPEAKVSDLTFDPSKPSY